MENVKEATGESMSPSAGVLQSVQGERRNTDEKKKMRRG